MNKTILLITAAAGLALAAPAFAEEVTTESKATTKVDRDSDGSYTEKRTTTQSRKDSEGTNVSAKTTVEVEADEDGNVEKTVKTEQVRDPKGLFNKEKTVVTDKVKAKDGEVETTHKKKVNGKTVEETTDKSH